MQLQVAMAGPKLWSRPVTFADIPMVDTIEDGSAALYADFDNRYLSRPGVDRIAVNDLPVIDLSPFTGNGSATERARTIAAIRSACINIGFFQISGHGVSIEEFDQLHDYGMQFFALPTAEKMKLDASKHPFNRGYIRPGGVNPGANPDKTADIKERFAMCREYYPGEPAGDGSTRAGLSQWPAPGVLPGFEDFLKTHIEKRVAIARHLLHALALGLDLPETYFDAAHHYPSFMHFYNYYPPCTPEKLLPNQWNFSPHTDYGMLTLLSQDDNGGLQVRNSEGGWIDVPPLRGAFVINIGDLLARWTNDVYTSNLHRVINFSGKARISVPSFFSPNGEAEISCIPTCQSRRNPARYPPVTAGAHSRELRAQSARTGRPGVSKSTAGRFKAR